MFLRPVFRRPLIHSFSRCGLSSEPKKVYGKYSFVELLADKTSLPKSDVLKVVNAFLEYGRREVVDNGAEIQLRGFGTFRAKILKARSFTTPTVAGMQTARASKKLTFKASAATKQFTGDDE